MSQQIKAGRVRLFKYVQDGKTTFKVHLDMEDGTKIEGKIFPNVGANDQIYYGGNVYFTDKIENKETKTENVDLF